MNLSAFLRCRRLMSVALLLGGGACAEGKQEVDVHGERQASDPPAVVVVSLLHRCVTRGGRVWCWGADGAGQTGQGASILSIRTDPTEVAALDGVVELAASDDHTCARLDNGRVACWGANGHRQSAARSAPKGTCTEVWADEGLVDVNCQPMPTIVPGLHDAERLALGDQRSCARRANRTVHCWGQSARGADWAAERTRVQELAIGDQAACVGQTDGSLACSGSQPEILRSFTRVEQLALSSRNWLSCVRHAGGRVNCWFDNTSGQRSSGNDPPPAPAIPSGARAIAVGWSHVCALVKDGAVMCWGRNGSGAVGRSVAASESCLGGPCEPLPRKVEGLPPVVALAAGGDSTCAVTADSRLFCWGDIQGPDNDGVPTYVPGPWEGP